MIGTLCVKCNTKMKSMAIGRLARVQKDLYYAGDVLECPICKYQVFTNAASEPIKIESDVDNLVFVDLTKD